MLLLVTYIFKVFSKNFQIRWTVKVERGKVRGDGVTRGLINTAHHGQH
jgi:hypothetical protein